jgi:hypothetical protein
MRLLSLLAIGCIIACFSACTKKHNNSPVAQKLHAGIWKISGSKIINVNGIDTAIDRYSTWRSCEQDDIITFDLDGTMNVNEGADKCQEDNQSNELSWELVDNDTRLRLTLEEGRVFQNGTNTTTGEITELTYTRLVIRAEDASNSVPITTLETYTNIR